MKAILSLLFQMGFLAFVVALATAWSWAFRRVRSGGPLLPSAKPRPIPWGAGSVGLVVLTWITANYLTVLAYYRLTGRPRGVPLSFLEMMLLATLINGLLVVLIPAALRVSSGARLRDLGLGLAGFPRHFFEGAVALVLVAPPIYLINFLCTQIWKPRTHPIQKMVEQSLSWEVGYLAVLSAVILAPAVEELLFRAVIQGWLTKVFELRPWDRLLELESELATLDASDAPTDHRDVDPGAPDASAPSVPLHPRPMPSPRTAGTCAIALTSALFALAHWEQWPAPIAIFFLSLALGIVYRRTQSLWSSLTLHALFNGLSTVMLFASLLAGSAPSKKEKATEAEDRPTAPLSAEPAPARAGEPSGLSRFGEDGHRAS